jgi:hypothetical protein
LALSSFEGFFAEKTVPQACCLQAGLSAKSAETGRVLTDWAYFAQNKPNQTSR